MCIQRLFTDKQNGELLRDSTCTKIAQIARDGKKRKETIMMILRQFSAEPSTIPTITSWYLADLSKAQGNRKEQ